jgi:RNA polymerase sigma-70 factor (ECF subfamily)
MTTEEFNERITVLRDKIFRFAARLTGDEEQAADVVQDVMERMWRRRGTLGSDENVEAYAMQAAHNRSYDYLRRGRMVGEKHRQMAQRSETVAETHPLEREEVRRAVAAAIAALPEKQRAAIHLRDIEGYEFDEISAIMNCDVATVRVYLSRARKAVGERLKIYRQG